MILSSCPVLENLMVDRCQGDNVDLFVVRVASLKVLLLRKLSDINTHGFVIDTPSLELLGIEEATGGFCGIEQNMPKIEAANVYVTCNHTEQIISSLTSLEQLGVCLSQDAYPEGTIFNWLVRLHLCTCDAQWLNVLMRLLKDSPKLRILRLEQFHSKKIYPRPCWKEPSHVPGCLLSSLETFEWMEYEGTEEEMEVARFILRNTSRLKRAAFYPESTNAEEELVMLMELSMSPRCSPMCQLHLGPRTFTKTDIFLDHRLNRSLKF
ncbi:putative FBD-associated F-box protein [Raphanus sativus]|uniref:Probable FBD-associated F-box protein At1g32375 n=1 Tax=Raphanus sativus TaxID=3726 RepID=A0A6J0NU91_RAPSA|nr:probable FBD-associated F-box protein At1g32375 [Raphanus sativus]KAJ4894503.1 putative FBD-associated F-box protein [Raphanus sativus]